MQNLWTTYQILLMQVKKIICIYYEFINLKIMHIIFLQKWMPWSHLNAWELVGFKVLFQSYQWALVSPAHIRSLVSFLLMWTHHGHNSQNKIHHNLEKQKDPTVQMPWRIATNTSNSKHISFIFLWRVLGTVRYFFQK